MQTMPINKKHIYVTGLPRSGSTVMCQILSAHDDIYSTGHSSPLAHAVDAVRQAFSNDEFMLAQMEADFDTGYGRLRNSYRGLMNGWFAETDLGVVVDKNRMWIAMMEFLADVDPDFRMVVCLRDLVQVYGSIEAQHNKTVLLDTVDKSATLTPQGRAGRLFNEGGMIGCLLGHIQSVIGREHSDSLAKHICWVRYEQLLETPQVVMDDVFAFCGVKPQVIDFNHLPVRRGEADSHYRFKFPHITREAFGGAEKHDVPDAIANPMRTQFDWYYRAFYPQQLP